MTHISCYKYREQSIFNGSVGQRFSRLWETTCIIPLAQPALALPSLFPPGSIWPISLWRAAWQYAFSLVLVFTVKKYVFIPNSFSSHCSYLCSLPGFPNSTVVLFLTSVLTQASCAWEGWLLCLSLWAPLVLRTLLSSAFLLPLTPKLEPCPKNVVKSGSWTC